MPQQKPYTSTTMNNYKRLGENMNMSDKEKNLKKGDLVFTALMFLFGLFFSIGAIRMPLAATTGAADEWYTAPGVFPLFIGAGIMFQTAIYFFSLLSKTGCIKKKDFSQTLSYFRSYSFKRLAIATGLLIFYIFVMIGNIS